jgi:hypothetical protein
MNDFQSGHATLRVGVIGAESSRPPRILDYLNSKAGPGDVSVVALALEQDEAVGNLSLEGVEVCKLVEFPDRVDAVIECTRDARRHLGHVGDLLRAGVHAWVDKPLATTEADARELVQAAEAGNAVLICSSGFRSAAALADFELPQLEEPLVVRGPADPDSPWGGLAYYGIHHVELALDLLWRAGVADELTVDSAGRTYDGAVATLHAGSRQVRLEFVRPTEGLGFTLSSGGRTEAVAARPDYLERQLDKFFVGIRAGAGTTDGERLIATIRVLEAILDRV